MNKKTLLLTAFFSIGAFAQSQEEKDLINLLGFHQYEEGNFAKARERRRHL